MHLEMPQKLLYKNFMKFKEIKRSFLRTLGNYFLYGAVNVLCKTVKFNIKNAHKTEEVLKDGKNIVLAFWHGTMLIPWYLQRNRNFSSLVSQSKDGDLLANILSRWNYNVERGSSHKGGKEALQMLIEKAKENFSISITPDGPTGPPKELKAGAVIIAQRSSIPLVLAPPNQEGKADQMTTAIEASRAKRIIELYAEVTTIPEGRTT